MDLLVTMNTTRPLDFAVFPTMATSGSTYLILDGEARNVDVSFASSQYIRQN